MTEAPSYQRLPTRRLDRRAPTRFDLTPDAGARAALAAALDLLSLPSVRFRGLVHPQGRADLVLRGDLEATVVQSCVVTLEPVTTALHDRVERRYLADYAEPAGEDVEMPEDDLAEPLPEVIDLSAVLAEALALVLPLYPRAAGAVLGSGTGGAAFAPPGVEPLTDADLRPFAGLAALRDKSPGPAAGDD